MIEYFDKEQFLTEPVTIEVVNDVNDLPLHCDDVRVVRPVEPSICIHVGEYDYDVRELIYRLIHAESQIHDLTSIARAMQDTLANLQADVFNIKEEYKDN